MTLSGTAKVLLRYSLLIFFVLLLVPAGFYGYPEPGLDNSWNIALNLAWKYHLVFGKDFLFAYGPLGILYARYPFAISKFIYLVADIYFLATLFFTIRTVFKKSFSLGVALFVFFCIMCDQYEGIFQWYYFFFCFYLFSFIKEPGRVGHLAQAAILSVLTFYVKVSLGMTTVFLFLLALTYVLVWKKWHLKWFIGSLLFYFLLMWLGAILLNVNLKGYILGSLQIISGYNSAMSRPVDHSFVPAVIVAVFILLLFFGRTLYMLVTSIRRKQLAEHVDEFFILIMTSLAIFVLFKSAFVRGDGHVNIFLKNFPMIGAFFFLYNPGGFPKRAAAICCWTGLALCFLVINVQPGGYLPGLRVLNGSFLTIKARELGDYHRQWGEYERVQSLANSLDTSANEYKAIIGNHTVDVIPTEVSTVYFNGLRYDPRPMMQSYGAYTEYLDSLNAAKYLSADAPDYILFSLATVDNRVPFFDESRTKLAILERYSVIGRIRQDLVLKKKDNLEKAVPLSRDTAIVALGEDIPVKRTPNLLFSRIFINNNLWGTVRGVLYQPPYLKVTFRLEDGETLSFKGAVPVLADGVLLNKFMESEDEFQLLMQADGRLNTNVVSIRFDPDSPLGGFKSSIKMVNTYLAFPQKTGAEQSEDSLGVVRLNEEYLRYKPIPLDTSLYKTDSFWGTMGTLLSHPKLLKLIDGWAFREKSKNDNNVVKVIARSAGKVYMLPSESQVRPDLLSAFNRKDVGYAGFTAKVCKSLLPPGDYQFGFLIIDTVQRKGWIRYSDRHAIIRKDYAIERIAPALAGSAGEKDLAFGMNPVKDNGYRASIEGWVFIKNADPNGDSTHLILRSDLAAYRIDVDSVRRADVAEHFKDPRLTYSGFTVTIPKDRLADGEYEVGIEKTYARRKLVAFTGQKIMVGMSAGTPVPLAALPPAGDFPANLESMKDGPASVILSGWAVQKMNAVDSSIIEIILKSGHSLFTVGTETKPRPDVTKAYKDKFNLDNCGFFSTIAKTALPAGKYDIGIHVYQQGNAGAVKWTGRSFTCK